jgi:aminoglycoside/choline kinase family phosphotransferase
MATTPPDRSEELQRFVALQHPGHPFETALASADASFRSYWRVTTGTTTQIVMDAPPDKENIKPWLDIGQRLSRIGLHVPHVFATDYKRGFILMEDFGSRLYLAELEENRESTARVDALYGDALDALMTMQTQVSVDGLPAFDEVFIKQELELMPAWFLERHLGYTLTCDDWDIVEAAFSRLIVALRAQPQVFMHRDLHSRNLMIVARNSPGIIDFQGAVRGPVGYDVASLLRDCYITWPSERVDAWIEQYRTSLAKVNHAIANAAHFRTWVDLAGLQRHIKVLGLFCRLNYRDGKSGFLSDLPLVLDYVLSVARLHADFSDLVALIERAVAGRDVTVASVETDSETA